MVVYGACFRLVRTVRLGGALFLRRDIAIIFSSRSHGTRGVVGRVGSLSVFRRYFF